MGYNISHPKSEFISLGLTTFLYGALINPSRSAFLRADGDGLSANRIVLYAVYHHGGDDILYERAYTSTSHKDPPSVFPNAYGSHYGKSTSYDTRSLD